MKLYVLYDRTDRAFIKSFAMNNSNTDIQHTRDYDEALTFNDNELQTMVNVANSIICMTKHDLTSWTVPWDSEIHAMYSDKPEGTI